MVVENVQRKRKQSTLPLTISVAEKIKSVCVEVSDKESNDEDSKAPCSICQFVIFKPLKGWFGKNAPSDIRFSL